MSLPEFPSGVNPFTALKMSVGDLFYRPPGRGFAARLILALVLCCLGLLLSITWLAIRVYQNRRKKSTFWFVKLLGRPHPGGSSGRYIIFNPKLSYCIVMCFSFPMYFALFFSFYRIFILKETARDFLFWTNLSSGIVASGFWVLVFAFFQSWLLIDIREGGIIPISPGWSNFLLCAGFVPVLGGWITAALSTIFGNRMYDAHTNFTRLASTYEATWDGNTQPEQLGQVLQSLIPIQTAYDKYFVTGVANVVFYMVLILVNAILALRSMSVIPALARFINNRVERLSQSIGASYSATNKKTQSSSNKTQAPTSFEDDMTGTTHVPNEEELEESNTSMTKQEVMELSKEKIGNPHIMQQVADILMLERTRSEMIITITVLLFVCVCTAGLSIYSAIGIFGGKDKVHTWAGYEMLWMGPFYLMMPSCLIGTIAIFWQTIYSIYIHRKAIEQVDVLYLEETISYPRTSQARMTVNPTGTVLDEWENFNRQEEALRSPARRQEPSDPKVQLENTFLQRAGSMTGNLEIKVHRDVRVDIDTPSKS